MRGDRGRRVRGRARAARGRVPALLATVTGLLLAAGAGAVIVSDRGASEIGGGDVAALTSPAPTAEPPETPVTDGRTLPADAAVPPTGLRIPAVDLTAPVDPVGIDPATGEFDVPAQVDRVGWYRFGPGLDAGSGSVVIAGHVDSAEQGPGAFFRLADLAPGDRIEVTGDDGSVRGFEVVGRQVYDKAEIPLERYFARDGAPRLTLITCGGDFDRDAGSYRDNVVVTAVPVS